MMDLCDMKTPAARRYTWGILAASALYAIALVISIYFLKRNPSAPQKYAIAILPVLPALWIPAVVLRFFRELDELQRCIQLEGLAFGFTATAVLTLSYGFLQNAGLPQINWVWVWPVMGVCWAIGLVLARWRYR
jgi:ABC-type cobalamin transport system permease subunit